MAVVVGPLVNTKRHLRTLNPFLTTRPPSLYHILQHCAVLYPTTLCCTILYKIALYEIVQHCTVLYRTTLRCTISYNIVLYHSTDNCVVPYHTKLRCTISYNIKLYNITQHYALSYLTIITTHTTVLIIPDHNSTGQNCNLPYSRGQLL